MATAVITGSTRGIGYGLAVNFLRRGWNVVINGRSAAAVDKAVDGLRGQETANGSAQAKGLSGDVTDFRSMEKLFAFAAREFGSVDIWVNNAGIGHPFKKVWELEDDQIRKVIDINVTGLLLASKAAVRGMLKQQHGHIYNMEGFGSNGRIMGGISVYGAAKRALRFASRSLARELRQSRVKVSRISPGMVITDLLTGQYEDDPEGFEQGKRIFNILGDKVETVTPWLVDKMINNKKNNALFEWLTPGKILFRFLTAGIRKRNLIP